MEETKITQTDKIINEMFEKHGYYNKMFIKRFVSFSKKDILDHIPKGPYCYDNEKVCIFWEKWDDQYHDQASGYCALLERGDFMDNTNDGTFLLWDQCKECGINDDDESLYS